MYQRRGGSQSESRTLDLIHIIFCIIILVMAVLAFLKPSENMMLFPLIFFLAAVLRLLDAFFLFRKISHEKKKKKKAVFELTVGILILILALMSAMTIWQA